ncbi:MAG: hypothetical protein HGA80_05195 [Candidatus Omnitrophica bacterium]|nr:hypothetical protein [Candidatus Omnitrophota bacterium]
MLNILRAESDRPVLRLVRRMVVACLVWTLSLGQVSVGYAAGLTSANLPEPGALLTPGGAGTPVILKGLVIHPEDPLKFDFLMDTGTEMSSGEELRREADRSIKYFLAALTVPEDDMWVNLSPLERDRIVPDGLGRTVLGRDLLAQDYVLKQLASSLLYPEGALGKKFWARLYETSLSETGRVDVDLDSFSRVWIMPAAAQVWEHDGKVVILKSRLKVMLEADYKTESDKLDVGRQTPDVSNQTPGPSQSSYSSAPKDVAERSRQILRELLIPALEREVNEGAHFARLRQVYAAMILSDWYKIRLRDGLLGKAYADRNKVAGIEFSDGIDKDAIYSRYLETVSKGVFNYIREENDPHTGEAVPRKYFSGGFVKKGLRLLLLSGILSGPLTSLPNGERVRLGEASEPSGSMIRVAAGFTDVGPKADQFYINGAVSSRPIYDGIGERAARASRDAAMGLSELINAVPHLQTVAANYQQASQESLGLLWVAGLLGAGMAAGLFEHIKIRRMERRGDTGGLLRMMQEARFTAEKRRIGLALIRLMEKGDAVSTLVKQGDRLERIKHLLFVMPTMLVVQNWYPTLSVEEVLFLWDRGKNGAFMLTGLFVYRVPYLKLRMAAISGNKDGLLSALRNGDGSLRRLAHKHLERFGWAPQDHTEQILQHLAKDDWPAVISVGHLAVPVLVQCLSDPDNSVVEKAREALLKIARESEAAGDLTVVTELRAQLQQAKEAGLKTVAVSIEYVLEQLRSDLSASEGQGAGLAATLEGVKQDNAQKEVGGIDLDARKLDLQIKRDGKGVPLPVSSQPWKTLDIRGFVPVIYRIEPVDMPGLLGLGAESAATALLKTSRRLP